MTTTKSQVVDTMADSRQYCGREEHEIINEEIIRRSAEWMDDNEGHIWEEALDAQEDYKNCHDCLMKTVRAIRMVCRGNDCARRVTAIQAACLYEYLGEEQVNTQSVQEEECVGCGK